MHCVADYIIIHGSDDSDIKVQRLLQRCMEHGIKLNLEKCRFNVDEIPFLSHVVTADGLKPDPSKVEAVLKMERSGDKEAVERLRCTVIYLARYVLKLTDVFRPIAALAQLDLDWMCSDAQEQAFTILKQILAEAPTLVYLDSSKLLHALAYDIDVKYLEGKNMYLADTLPRAFLPRCELLTH